MLMTSPSKQKKTLLSEINVTPFVDVMLVLLIIFMATAPMLQQGIGIELPEAKNTKAKISKEPFILQIKKDQKIYIGTQSILIDDLKEKLVALKEYKQIQTIYLQADKRVPYGVVAQTLGEIKAGGISNVSLVTAVK